MVDHDRRIKADFAVTDATLITMDARRSVIRNGAIAVLADRIIWVGKTADLLANVNPTKVIDYRHKVITPGFINAHVHITGDPLTRHYMPDDLNDPDKLMSWVIPRFNAHDEQDEHVSATFGALELLKSGSTTFVEAGTVHHLDHVVQGLKATGIRARVSHWVEGQNFGDPSQSTALSDAAIALLDQQNTKYPDHQDMLIAAWPILVGHNTNSDAVWQAAKAIADTNNVRLAAHMSPYVDDPNWYLEHTGRRPIEHLDHLGVLGHNTLLTHATHLDIHEVRLIAENDARIVFCPFAALKGAFGVASNGRYLELLRQNVQFALATDGYDCDILAVTRLAAAMFKDMAEDVGFIGAIRALEMVTCEAAKVIGLDHEIGTLEIGKKADFLCFDTNSFQWRPLLSPIDQLIWSADARSLADVWVNGVKVIENGQSTLIDEQHLLHDVQQRAEHIIKRTKLPYNRSWTTI